MSPVSEDVFEDDIENMIFEECSEFAALAEEDDNMMFPLDSQILQDSCSESSYSVLEPPDDYIPLNVTSLVDCGHLVTNSLFTNGGVFHSASIYDIMAHEDFRNNNQVLYEILLRDVPCHLFIDFELYVPNELACIESAANLYLAPIFAEVEKDFHSDTDENLVRIVAHDCRYEDKFNSIVFKVSFHVHYPEVIFANLAELKSYVEEKLKYEGVDTVVYRHNGKFRCMYSPKRADSLTSLQPLPKLCNGLAITSSPDLSEMKTIRQAAFIMRHHATPSRINVVTPPPSPVNSDGHTGMIPSIQLQRSITLGDNEVSTPLLPERDVTVLQALNSQNEKGIISFVHYRMIISLLEAAKIEVDSVSQRTEISYNDTNAFFAIFQPVHGNCWLCKRQHESCISENRSPCKLQFNLNAFVLTIHCKVYGISERTFVYEFGKAKEYNIMRRNRKILYKKFYQRGFPSAVYNRFKRYAGFTEFVQNLLSTSVYLMGDNYCMFNAENATYQVRHNVHSAIDSLLTEFFDCMINLFRWRDGDTNTYKQYERHAVQILGDGARLNSLASHIEKRVLPTKDIALEIDNADFLLPIADNKILDLRSRQILQRNCTHLFSSFLSTQLLDPGHLDVLRVDSIIDTYFPAYGDYLHKRYVFKLFLGSLLYADVSRERVFAIFIGKGLNGKSTLCTDLLANVLDSSYMYKEVPPSFFVQETRSAQNGHSASLMSCRTARVICSPEFRTDDCIDVPKIKSMCAGDMVTGREAYGRTPYTFMPKGTIIIHTNFVPYFKVDQAVLDRMLFVNFETRFVADEEMSNKPPDAHYTLRNPEAVKFLRENKNASFSCLANYAKLYHEECVVKKLQLLQIWPNEWKELKRKTMSDEFVEDAADGVYVESPYEWLWMSKAAFLGEMAMRARTRGEATRKDTWVGEMERKTPCGNVKSVQVTVRRHSQLRNVKLSVMQNYAFHDNYTKYLHSDEEVISLRHAAVRNLFFKLINTYYSLYGKEEYVAAFEGYVKKKLSHCKMTNTIPPIPYSFECQVNINSQIYFFSAKRILGL